MDDVPEVRLTNSDMLNLPAFFESVENEYGKAHGAVKLLPPHGWKPRPSYADVGSYEIDTANRQTVIVEGDAPAYLLQNEPTEMSKDNDEAYTLDHFRELALSHDSKLLGRSMLDIEEESCRGILQTNSYYCLDVDDSFFGVESGSLHLCNLPNLLRNIPKRIPGVTTSYLYFGMAQTRFPWHVEDHGLLSINYLHYGAAKIWYVIPAKDAKKFRELATRHYPKQFRLCPNAVQHRQLLLPPEVVVQDGIKLSRVCQREGEFILTFADAHHSGLNVGHNVAEATNIATRTWYYWYKNSRDVPNHASGCEMEDFPLPMDTLRSALASFVPPPQQLKVEHTSGPIYAKRTYKTYTPETLTKMVKFVNEELRLKTSESYNLHGISLWSSTNADIFFAGPDRHTPASMRIRWLQLEKELIEEKNDQDEVIAYRMN